MAFSFITMYCTVRDNYQDSDDNSTDDQNATYALMLNPKVENDPNMEYPNFSTKAQFSIGDNLDFIDRNTKQHETCVKSMSLPSQFPYFIDSYDSDLPLLCLDLDETLIVSTAGPSENVDFQITVRQCGAERLFSVKKRPFLKEFLDHVQLHFTLAIFTFAI